MSSEVSDFDAVSLFCSDSDTNEADGDTMTLETTQTEESEMEVTEDEEEEEEEEENREVSRPKIKFGLGTDFLRSSVEIETRTGLCEFDNNVLFFVSADD